MNLPALHNRLSHSIRKWAGIHDFGMSHAPRSGRLVPRVGYAAGALLVGLAVGVAVLVAGPLVPLAALVGVVLLGLAFPYPELLILVVLSFTSGLIPEQYNIYISSPVGTVQVSDLLLFWLLFIAAFRIWTDPSFDYVSTSLDLPMFIFCLSIVAGFIVSVFRFGINFSDATYEARMLMYYVIFFVVTNLVRTQAQVQRLINGLIIVGVLLAISMILQSALGGATEQAAGLAFGQDPTRVFDPGSSVVYIILITLMTYIVARDTTLPAPVLWFMILLLSTALFTTLARNLIVSGAVSFALLVLVLRNHELSQLAQNFLGIVVVTGGLIAILALSGREGGVLNYAFAYLERLQRMLSPDIVTRSENLAPRWLEMQYAWDQISQYPLTGIGLYNDYRPPFYANEPYYIRAYIHNAYLGIWLKTGLVGLVSFIWLSVAFLKRGFQQWRYLREGSLGAVVLGFTLAYVGTMLSNVVAPSFVQPGSLSIFGLILGASESILSQRETSSKRAKGVAYHGSESKVA